MLAALCLSSLLIKIAFLFVAPETQQFLINHGGFQPGQISVAALSSQSGWLDKNLLTLLTALFIHADWPHLLGNLAYLMVFGVAVEKALGNWLFGVLFLLLGGLANLYAAIHLGDLATPIIGASSGVSAVMGIYLGLFPRRRMGLWIPLGLYLDFVRVPALMVIGSWFTLQLLYSIFGPVETQVAWSAHIAGFLLGLLAATVLRLFPRRYNLAYRDD